MTDATRLAAIRQLGEVMKLGTPSDYIYVSADSRRTFTDLRSAFAWLLEMYDEALAARQQAEQERDFERGQHKRWVEIASKRAIEIEQLEDQIQDAKEAAEQQVTALTQQRDFADCEVLELTKQATALRAALEHYGAHDDDCDCYVDEDDSTKGCTCGLSAALAGSRAPEPKPHA